MKKKFLLPLFLVFSILFFVLVVSFFGQNGPQEAWVVQYNGPGDGFDAANRIATDTNSNVYVTGASSGIDTGNDITTLKYNKNGSLLWVARYNGPGNGDDGGTGIVLDGENNVYVTGYSFGSDTDRDYVTIKYDSNGNVIWIRRYNGRGNQKDTPAAIAIDSGDNVIITGASYGGFYRHYDCVTVKYDSNGNVVFISEYDNGIGHYDEGRSVALDDLGNIYITGSTHTGAASWFDWLTIKYDSDGNKIWSRTFDSGQWPSMDYAHDIVLDKNGNCYVTGEVDLRASGPSGLDIGTIKYDSNGNEIWVRYYTRYSNFHDIPVAIVVDENSNIYVTGFSSCYETKCDFVTIKYDSNGNELWVQIYTGPGKSNDYPANIVLDKYGNIYVTGDSPGLTSRDSATVKYDPYGNEIWVSRHNELYPNDITLDIFANVYITGRLFNPSSDYDYVTVKYSDFIEVDIDIKPGSDPNSINLGSQGNVPVAIFSTLGFDATAIDPITVTLAGTSVKLKGKGTPMSSFEDINGDGLLDIIVHFDTTTLELSEGDTEAILEGETYKGTRIRGIDTVKIVNE